MHPQLIDTHCHLHDSEFYPDPGEREAAYERAITAQTGMIVVGSDERSSNEAVDFAATHNDVWAVVGVHPHDTKLGWSTIAELAKRPEVVGIGEIGLDYFYMNSQRDDQIRGLEAQLQIAQDNTLPISFHVRDEKATRGAVWRDFWPIFDNFHGLRGVLHSFTDSQGQLDQGFSRGLYVGVNGIATFTKDKAQQEMYAQIPLEKMVLETDAPFLTPVPFRGTMNEPSFVGRVAEHVATLKNVSFSHVAATTTKNAQALYHL